MENLGNLVQPAVNFMQPALNSNLGQTVINVLRVSAGTYGRVVAITAVAVAVTKLAQASSYALAYSPLGRDFLTTYNPYNLTQKVFTTVDNLSQSFTQGVATKVFKAEVDGHGRLESADVRKRVERAAFAIELTLAVAVVAFGATRVFQLAEIASPGLGTWNALFEAGNFPVRFTA